MRGIFWIPSWNPQGLGSIAKHGVPFSRILLVDDDLLELERAKTRGIQVYAAPEDGGLQDEDFDAISESDFSDFCWVDSDSCGIELKKISSHKRKVTLFGCFFCGIFVLMGDFTLRGEWFFLEGSMLLNWGGGTTVFTISCWGADSICKLRGELFFVEGRFF